MALVAYDYDSSSENEEESESCLIASKDPSIKSKVNTEIHTIEAKLSQELKPYENNLFSTLPQTKTVFNEVQEEQIEDFVPKSKPLAKSKERVRITIPSLSQFNDIEDDEPQAKKQKPSSKDSGLISILPPVKGSVTTAKSFIPNAVKNKSNANVHSTTTTASSLVPNSLRKKAEAKKLLLLQKLQEKKMHTSGSDIESDDDIDMPETFDQEMWEKVCGRPKPKQVKPIQEFEPVSHQEIVNIAPEPEKPYDGLDNQAFKELIGKSKRPIGNIKLIDINEEEILPEKDLWMTKSLTDPELAPKAQVEDPVDPTRRKKHHITYLAQQAKANEQELQNVWSASKNNRMATRAKYGF